MSAESSVSIMAGTATRKLLPVVEEWVRARERAAGFARVGGGAMASHAEVIVGNVNYLDIEELKALIRDAVKDEGWNYWEPVGLTVYAMDPGAIPEFSRLDSSGEWQS